MKLINAKEFEKTVHLKVKESKFDSMVKFQLNIIEETMKEGRKSVRWIFNDKARYTNEFQKTWINEFNTRAIELFEAAGYKIEGIMISW